MTELVFPVKAIEQLRNQLFKDDGDERIGFGYAGKSDDRFLVSEVHVLDDDEYHRRGPTRCRAKPDVEQLHVNECLKQDKHPVLIHSHPFDHSENVAFSPIDEDILPPFSEWVTRLFPDTEVLFAVFGTQSVAAATVENEATREIPVSVPGDHKLKRHLAYTDSGEDADLNQGLYDRSIRCFTEEGQRRLAATKAAIIGAGGLGSILCEQSLRLGIEDLVVIDPDIVEESNRNRLQGAHCSDVDRPKVKVVEERLNQYNPDASVETFQAHVQECTDVLRSCDLLVAGVDSMNARMWLNEFAVQHLIPYVDAGVLITQEDDDVTSMQGGIQTVLPGATGCLKCLDRYNPEQAEIDRLSEDELAAAVEEGYIEDTALSPEPAVMPLNTTVAGMTADVVAKLVTRVDAPPDYLQFEGLDSELKPIHTQPFDTCPVCTELLGEGTDKTDFDEFETSEEVADISDEEIDSEAALAGEDDRSEESTGSVSTWFKNAVPKAWRS